MEDKWRELTQAHSNENKEARKGEVDGRCKQINITFVLRYAAAAPPSSPSNGFGFMNQGAPQGEGIVHSCSLGRLRSYTGKTHFNIYLHEYVFFLSFLLFRGVKEEKKTITKRV